MDKMVTNNFSAGFFKGRKVFITGHTGFKGAWLSYILSGAGAFLKGYALRPGTKPSLFEEIEASLEIDSVFADINDYQHLEDALLSFQPDIVFHLAAQSLVRRSYQQPINTFETNIMGTANLLQALTKLQKKCVSVLITTDKVYENKEWLYPYRETDRLGGSDPYSASKACAELVINSYRQSFFHPSKQDVHNKSIVSVRAGNVIGGGDWSEDRLIPDIVRSLVEQKDIAIRNPGAIRPWQHVLEPIEGYLELATAAHQHPTQFDGAWNFGPATEDHLAVLSVAEMAVKVWGSGTLDIQENPAAVHEAGLLKLDISKARNNLNWKPRMNTAKAVDRTINWYKSFNNRTASAASLMESDIVYYSSLIPR
ncbi:MAG: CDP-glucose 4,6-dehydratase [Ferruginibacter sp.]|nr:CDP-glucose 4,6-dehydratase [Ferruginibacter sp.]